MPGAARSPTACLLAQPVDSFPGEVTSMTRRELVVSLSTHLNGLPARARAGSQCIRRYPRGEIQARPVYGIGSGGLLARICVQFLGFK